MKKYLLPIMLFLCSFNAYSQNIHRTVCQGNLTRLDSLLQHQSTESIDNRGRTLMHWAVACRKKKVIEYLVKKGADLNGEDYNRQTAMHIAIKGDNEEYFDFLVELQADGQWKKTYGPSLLQVAILYHSQHFIQKLVKLGVDVNAVNHRGSTPYEIATRIGARELVILLENLGADKSKVRKIELKGAYMGQELPKSQPLLFAPNVISTEEHEFGSVFNRAGDEFYYGVDMNGKAEIRCIQLINGTWTSPVDLLPDDQYGYNDPFLSPDENRLYFISPRALDGVGEAKQDYDIWYVERSGDGWSAPINAGPKINSERNEYYISFTEDGTMYFSSGKASEGDRDNMDIYAAPQVDGVFQEAVSLGDAVNTEVYEADVFIDPAEEYVIFCSTRSDSYGRGDLYISFKDETGKWTTSMNIGGPINTKFHELCPYVSADGKYLFYTSNGDIYWVSTDFIDKLKKEAFKK